MIVFANFTTGKFIHYCVVCRSLRGKLEEKKLAEPTFDRLQEEPQFTYCGVGLFAPCTICSKRKDNYYYGVMFTNLCRRYSFSRYRFFLLTLQRFIGKRGNICQMRGNIRSDNESNFIGAVKEMWKPFQDMNNSRISNYLQIHWADWIIWISNSLTVSHMGGVWERQIRTSRGILNALVKTYGENLYNKSTHTLLVEVEAIVNSRPMTTETINYVKSDISLWPANLLTMRSKVILSPPGCFSSADIYCQKRWRTC